MAKVFKRNLPPTPEDTLLTGSEVATLLRCSPATVRRMGLADTLRRVDVGGLVFYTRESVDRLRHGVDPSPTQLAAKSARESLKKPAPKPAARDHASAGRALKLLGDTFKF